AFKSAFINGFGIETDLRDFNQNIVISHDMPKEGCMTFSDFISMASSNNNVTLALNIKSDGLQSTLGKLKLDSPHFYFDMSVPDMLHYCINGSKFYTRYSDIETTPSLYFESHGIWLDNFKDDTLNLEMLEHFLKDGKNVVLVSPELHKRNKSNYWKSLRHFLISNQEYVGKVGLCTDFPFKAREYFNEQ
uniref:hypothetical protein n=1 Tax=Vibrio vulnificus TaxID=672 RepID=UPI001EEBCE5F